MTFRLRGCLKSHRTHEIMLNDEPRSGSPITWFLFASLQTSLGNTLDLIALRA
jgi:hypothetical protein